MKATMSIVIYASILLIFAASVQAQNGTVQGKVTDEFGSLPGASVILIQAETKNEVRGTITNDEGNYTIQAEWDENFYLEISYMGYENFQTKTVKLNENRQAITLDPIHMTLKTEFLQSVTVAGTKRPISFSDGKMTIEIENSPMAKGESAFSLLPQIPGISISQNGEIQLHGKSGVQIMINDRKSYLKGDELKTYLESLPADALSNIQLDTKPSASQDAEGSAGILNITIKKNKSEHLTGSISAGYIRQNKDFWNGNLFLAKQHKKWDWSLIADISEKGHTRNQALKTDFNENSSLNNLSQTGKEIVSQRPVFSQLMINYDINKDHTIGVSIELGNKKTDREWNSKSLIFERNNPDVQQIQSFNTHDEKFKYGILNAHYKWTTDTLGSGLRIAADASKVGRDINSEFKNHYTTSDNPELFQAPANNSYQIFAANADYIKKWQNKMELKVGTKFSHVQFKSNLDFFIIENNHSTFDPERSNAFDYDENIWANYLEFGIKLTPDIKMNAGLRMEKTFGKGIQHSIHSENKKNYSNWFPNISFNQTINENYQIDYAYTKRITRPHYDLLNPQIFYIDPYNIAEGNPDLEPQITHSVSINNLIKSKYQIGIHFDYMEDFMAEVPMTKTETNQTFFSTRNMSQAMQMGINAHVPIKILNGWNMNNSLIANYHFYKLDLEEEINRKNEHIFILFQNQQQIQLPQGISLNINLGIRSPFKYGYYKLRGQWWTDMSVKKSFLNNKLDLSLKFTDIFKSTNVDVDYQFNNDKSSIKQYMGTQSASLHLTYKFGGQNEASKKHPVNFEEFDRVKQ